jgi:cellobiose phosphorylase
MLGLTDWCGRYEADVEFLRQARGELVEALLTEAWDGQWWLRGYDDDGNPFGSDRNERGKIFLNAQNWAVLSGVGSDEQLRSGMDAAAERLDTGIGLQVLAPSYPTWPEVKSPFSSFVPGTNENGAIFCHANTWAIIAEALLGRGNRAWKYFTQLIPANVIKAVGVDRYRAEPYAWVSQIIGPENPLFGWANVEQVTGTATWMDVAATQYLLGIRPEPAGLRIDPCIPGDWPGFRVQRSFRGCRLDIDVQNPDGVENGVAAIHLEGQPLDIAAGPVIPVELLTEKKQARICVQMGLAPA